MFIGSVIYGEVFVTGTFDAFLKEQDFRLDAATSTTQRVRVGLEAMT